MSRPVRRIMRDPAPGQAPERPRRAIPADAVELDAWEVGKLGSTYLDSGDYVMLRVHLPRPIAEPATEEQAMANVAVKAEALACIRALVGREVLLGVAGDAPPPPNLDQEAIRQLVQTETSRVAGRREMEAVEIRFREAAERAAREREERMRRIEEERRERLRRGEFESLPGMDRLERAEQRARARAAGITSDDDPAATAGYTGIDRRTPEDRGGYGLPPDWLDQWSRREFERAIALDEDAIAAARPDDRPFPRATLFGRPIVWTDRPPTLGEVDRTVPENADAVARINAVRQAIEDAIREGRIRIEPEWAPESGVPGGPAPPSGMFRMPRRAGEA